MRVLKYAGGIALLVILVAVALHYEQHPQTRPVAVPPEIEQRAVEAVVERDKIRAQGKRLGPKYTPPVVQPNKLPPLLTVNELVDRWGSLVGKTVTVLVPSYSMFNGASVLYPLSGKANIHFHFPIQYLSQVEVIASDGFIRQKFYVRGIVNPVRKPFYSTLHVSQCRVEHR